jgi:HTH-type transcriptional regulator / antitoxin HigA
MKTSDKKRVTREAVEVDEDRGGSAHPGSSYRQLKSAAELNAAIEAIDKLLLKGRLNALDQARLDLLTDSVEKYEEAAHPMPAVSDVEMLRHLIDARGVTQMKLAEETGISMSTISAILHGKRKMTLGHIRIFARHFGVKAGAFLP